MENEVLLTMAAWGAAVAGVAAGAKGFSYLIRSGAWGLRRLKRAADGIGRLASIGDTAAWPNGSTDLPTFLQGLHATVQKLLGYHEAEFWGTEAGLAPRVHPDLE